MRRRGLVHGRSIAERDLFAGRVLCESDGTYLGAMYENTAYACVKGNELNQNWLIRVAPPKFFGPFVDESFGGVIFAL